LPPLLPLVLLVGLLSSSAVVDKGLPDLLLPAEKLPVARLDMVPFWLDCWARRTCMHATPKSQLLLCYVFQVFARCPLRVEGVLASWHSRLLC
jgi:hypothetical protein